MNLTINAPVHLRPIIITAFHTGMRKGEILNLKWQNIDRKAGFIRLPAEMVKEKKAKSIPINHHVQEVFDKIPRSLKSDYVFLWRGKRIKSDIRRSLLKASQEAGLTYGQNVLNGWRLHDIRGTVKTFMLRAGVDPAIRSILLGHSLKGMDIFDWWFVNLNYIGCHKTVQLPDNF